MRQFFVACTVAHFILLPSIRVASAGELDVHRSSIPSMTVTAAVLETVVPDRAILTVQVSVDRLNGPDALAALGQDSKAIVAAAVEAGVPAGSIKTEGLRLGQPTKRELDSKGQQVLVTLPGRRATQVLRIGFKDARQPSIVLPKLMEAGLQNIVSLAYEVSDQSEREKRLKGRAVAAAVEQARNMISAAPVRLGRILRIGSGYEVKADLPSADRSGVSSFQLEPGTVDLISSIDVVFELLPKRN